MFCTKDINVPPKSRSSVGSLSSTLPFDDSVDNVVAPNDASVILASTGKKGRSSLKSPTKDSAQKQRQNNKNLVEDILTPYNHSSPSPIKTVSVIAIDSVGSNEAFDKMISSQRGGKNDLDSTSKLIANEDFQDFGRDFDDYEPSDNSLIQSPSKDVSSPNDAKNNSTLKRRVSFGVDTKSDNSDVNVSSSASSSRKNSKSSFMTPTSVDGNVLRTPDSQINSEEFVRGRVIIDDSFRSNDDDAVDTDHEDALDEDGEIDKSGFTSEGFSILQSNKKRRDDGVDTDPGGMKFEKDDNGNVVRKSTRRLKGQRLAFWKNERPIYKDGGVFAGVSKAAPTPRKPVPKKRGLSRLSGLKSKTTAFGSKKRKSTDEQDGEVDDDDDDDDILGNTPRFANNENYLYKEREHDNMLVWDEFIEDIQEQHVFCTKKSLMPPTPLPITATRRVNNFKVGVAAQYFNMNEIPGLASGWIAGYVELPGGAIKDEEIVGEYVQVFFVSECESGTVELGLSDPTLDEWDDSKAQRILLKKGDCFFVPPANIYRLENHGRNTCVIFWTIIKPVGAVDRDVAVEPNLEEMIPTEE